MAELADHIARAHSGEELPLTVMHGHVAIGAGSESDPIWVTIPSFDDERHRHGPCPWPSRVNNTGDPVFPQQGDLVLVAVADDGETWVIGWWPYAL